MFIAGVLGISGIAIYEFVIDTSVPTQIKVPTGLVWIGTAVVIEDAYATVLGQTLSTTRSSSSQEALPRVKLLRLQPLGAGAQADDQLLYPTLIAIHIRRLSKSN